jgi:hypothetical protein
LETARLLLRPLTAADYEPIDQILHSEIEGDAFTRAAFDPEISV